MACQTTQAAPPPVDVECTSGLPFAQRVVSVSTRDDPQLHSLSTQLAKSQTLEQNQLVMAGLAGVLARQEADLHTLRPPAGDIGLVEGLIVADDNMRSLAGELATASLDAQVRRRGEFLSDAQNRQLAAQALQLRAQFIASECS